MPSSRPDRTGATRRGFPTRGGPGKEKYLPAGECRRPVSRAGLPAAAAAENVQEWWALQDSNLRPPPCKGDALAAAPSAHLFASSTLVQPARFDNPSGPEESSQDTAPRSCQSGHCRRACGAHNSAPDILASLITPGHPFLHCPDPHNPPENGRPPGFHRGARPAPLA